MPLNTQAITEGKNSESQNSAGLLSESRNGSFSLQRAAIFIALAIGVIGGLQIFYANIYPIHHDLAGSILSGQLAVILGDRFSDYSLYFPPAEQAWFSLAVWISDLIGLSVALTVILVSSLALLFSVGLAFHLRRVTVGASPLFLIVSAAILVVIPILFKNVFGLREHMVVLGLWPYLILRLSDPNNQLIGWKTRLLVGLWLGATLLFKYLYSIVVLLVEVADMILRRRPALLFRLENLIAGAIVALYLFLWLILDPSQREAISTMVNAMDANLMSPQDNLKKVGLYSGLAVYFILLATISKHSARTTVIGLAMVAGAIIVSLIQSRWYTHHLFPILMAYIAWYWMIQRKSRLMWQFPIAMVIAGMIFLQFVNSAKYQIMAAELDQAMEQSGHSVEGKRVGLLTMHPSPFSEYLATHGAVRWTASVNNSYVAAELKSLDVPENAATPPPPVRLDDPGRQMLHSDMLRLWEDMPPDVLILDQSSNWPLKYLDVEWRNVFSSDPRFEAIMQRYRPVFSHSGARLDFEYYELIE